MSRRTSLASPKVAIAIALTAGTAALAAVALEACGSSSSNATVVRIGSWATTRSTVAHWASVIVNGGSASTLREDVQLTPREHALEFLILSHWLLGEAAALGFPVGDKEITAAVAEQKSSMPGGSREFQESLQTTGETEADVRLRIAAHLAARALSTSLVVAPVHVSRSEARAYFDAHWRRFAIPERRKTEIAEHIRSFAVASRLKRSMERTGSRTQLHYHEWLTKQNEESESVPVAQAIFDAPEGVLMGPVLLPVSGYVIFEVTRILPKVRRSFSELRKSITQELQRRRLKARQTRFRTRFDRDWERSWRAKTECQPGYVVSLCEEHKGAEPHQGNPFSSEGPSSRSGTAQTGF